MFEEIENNVAVEKIGHKGVSIWPIIKSYGIEFVDEMKVVKTANLSNIRILLKSLAADLISLSKLKKSPYWVFTNSERRYYINDLSFDRVTTGLIKYIDNYVLFENPIPKGRTKQNKLHQGEHLVGMSWIFLLQFLTIKLTSPPKIENLHLLEEYLGEDMSMIKKVYHRIYAGSFIYGALMRMLKPKAIFVVCYYSQFELISAAKKYNIPVIELQHGLITEGHRAYFFKAKQSKKLMPDFFLSYGKYFSNIVSQGHLVGPNHVLDYGYSFLEEVGKHLTISPKLSGLKEQYGTLVCVTGQLETTDTELLRMIKKVSNEIPNICFLFKPRLLNSFSHIDRPINLLIAEDINTYELLKFCDVHITVYSTCALESLALGTPNVSIDIKGYYSKYMEHLLGDNPYNYEVRTFEDLRKTLQNLQEKTFEKEIIQKSIGHIFSPMVPPKTFHGFFQKIMKEISQQ